ncbi:LysR family transcriptional regulator [Bacillus safensis]|uniref:LysR family transcriptional regulator n=1 Tax=Bacillus safensis TaxID=561879 RepID=UPI000F863B36|nr:LysR family transcriptional regulator [Bacillus safensis]MBU5209653.1 LysR family transcriptional regulator [Bacillus safensis]RUK40449.1 LysR family transcriptional regulator [Bacillus safensis]WCL57890.1 LysR family transcriptional regulator [Bacillus safensis]
MTITQLYIFLKVVEEKNFTKASEILHISQPAVSHAISGLERTLGVSLFIRDKKKGLEITEIGRKVVPYAKELIKQYESIEHEVRLFTENKADVIHISGFPSITSVYMPKLISYFKVHDPSIQLSFTEGSVNKIKELVMDGSVDFGITIITEEDHQSIFLFEEEMVIVAPTPHPLGEGEEVKMEEVVDEQIILCGHGFEKSTIEAFRQHHLELNISHIVDSVNTALSMVKGGLGIALLSRKSFEYLPETLQTISFTPTLHRKIGIIYSKDKPLRKSVQLCIKEIGKFNQLSE